MNITTLLGLALGFGAIILAFTIEGGSLGALLNLPAAVIVIGGTFAAAIISFPMGYLLRLPVLLAKTVAGGANDSAGLIDQFAAFAAKARREGLLSLEEEAEHLSDSFSKKGLQLVIDGTDPEVVRNILETELEAIGKRHEDSYGMLEAMGGYAPTMGIIGTVMGLVNVLGNLSNPDELGPAIAVAFLATFYGIGTANLLWLPLGRKLKETSKAEAYFHQMALEGILSVQAGDNPRIVRGKLEAFLSPAQRNRGVAAGKGGPIPSETPELVPEAGTGAG